jgi:opacity protein-like surface antigen
MNWTILAAAGLVLGGISAAQAADPYAGGGLKDGPVAYDAPVWTGKYIGAFGGYVFDDKSPKYNYYDDEVIALAPFYPKKPSSFDEAIGGVHAGWAWSTGRELFGFSFFGGEFIWGVEGDIGFSDKIDYLASLRTRSGIAWGDWLLYSTSGIAFLSFDNPITFDRDDHKVGYVYGGGIEKFIKPGWSVGAEGLFYDFDKDKGPYYRDNGDFWQVRGKLTYHLSGEPSLEPLK